MARSFDPNRCCGDYAARQVRSLDELVALADEKGAVFWKALGTVNQGCVFALTGNASKAVQMITSGIIALRSTGATVFLPVSLHSLARAYAELGQFDDAWRCINEAMTRDRNNQREMVRGRGQSHRR